MAKRTDIGDPFEKATTTGKIGGKSNATTGQFKPPTATAPVKPPVEEEPQRPPAKRKAKAEEADPLEQQTVYMPRSKRKFLRIHAAHADKDISDIVNEALDLYRAKYNV